MAVLLLALALLIAPIAADAADQQVLKFVDSAINAVRTTSYEARMTYLSPFDGGLEQQVHIYHVAPELFRVVPIENGAEGNTVYIENAVELTQIRNGYAEIMPKRQFYTNNNLTIKFLRDLGQHEGTTLLDGIAAGHEVHVLRQELSQDKPYTITVGLDKQNYFPVFLLVLDGEGARRVYYQMEAIEYASPMDLDDNLFLLEGNYKQLPAPRVKSATAVEQVQEDQGEVWMPLIPDPATLPANYFLESISVLDYQTGKHRGNEPVIVYQLAIFGPQSDLLSIFQTRSGDLDLEPQGKLNCKNEDYLVTNVDGWTIAAFGSLSEEQLLEIIQGLHIDKVRAGQLIEESAARQSLLYSD